MHGFSSVDDCISLCPLVQLTVANLFRNGSTLSWSAPSSPDLTDVDPDIVYCVEVYNVTCGRRDIIIHDCNVLENTYSTDALRSGFIYEYIHCHS